MKNLNLINNSIKITAALLLANALLLTPAMAREVGQIFQPFMFSGSAIAEMFIDKCVSGNCVNGKGKKVYENGNTYEGDFVDSKLEGQGTFTVTNGQIYIGQFANNMFNGRGKITFPTGDIYEGDWIDNKREGQGTLTFPNGSYYIGEWKNGNVNGYAKYYDKAANTVQEGTWKDGVLVNSTDASVQANLTRTNLLNKTEVYSKPVRGLGKEIDTLTAELKTNTSTPARVKELYNLIEQYSLKILTARQEALKVLNLEPESAEKTDLKKLVEADIAVMNTNLKAVGQWKDLELKDKSTASTKCVSGDCVNGRGKMVYTNGDNYDGDFVDGKKVGQGTYTYTNGQIYVGQFFDNLRNGKGKFTFSDGSIYEGSFANDNFIGNGTYTSKSGSNQTGKFTVGQIVDLQSEIVDTYFWGKAEIIEILGDKYKVRDLMFKTIEVVTEQKIRPFTIPIKYEIGQKVEALDKGIWYKGEIIGLENNDHYRIRFEYATDWVSSEYVRYIRPGIATSNAQTKVTSNQTTANTNGSSSGNAILSNAKEAAVDANLVAKKAVIDSITASAGAKKTNKERIEPAKQMLKLQNELVQYLTDAINGNDLSETAKAKYRKPLETEKLKVRQLENLLKLTIEAAKDKQ